MYDTSSAVLFDFIGTTVLERDPTLINRCFEQAFHTVSGLLNSSFIQANRGRSKREVIASFVREHQLPLQAGETIYASFLQAVAQSLDQFHAAPAIHEVIHYLRSRGYRIGLGTGLPRDLFMLIRDVTGLKALSFDYVGFADEVGAGRPDPVMIFDMMKHVQVTDTSQFYKVGDTVSDIEEGKRAGVKTIAVLSGTQPEQLLRAHAPDYCIHSLSELKQYL